MAVSFGVTRTGDLVMASPFAEPAGGRSEEIPLLFGWVQGAAPCEEGHSGLCLQQWEAEGGQQVERQGAFPS